ncbi:hypothetical protein AGABI1DRAFT_135023 [Agaricus bisporus var. burnettii JB137-S8]|uniref:Uncharacterized protein n=1 Tax=Agaricus bisporus var. burnettii (strain JB137-S8 / ATCC MYA-4627 / FGSC 10392) TaxID=597362 RepID=K5XG23_AGABU|nr:uncharacterized protein AGABI1DRAFT_135023 [Agaricus bisporus var. burnettii JB137-S8]EKM73335.1 hypothetical protein AGABI1DRAFT_135023 [Agaricus bisporus var. burnettii JB137-S8]
MSCELDRFVQKDWSSQWRKPLLLPPFVLFISGQLQLFPIRRPALICMSRKFQWFETKRLGIGLEEEDKSSYGSDSVQVVMVDPSHKQRTDHEFVWEKPHSIFTNRCMIAHDSHETSE